MAHYNVKELPAVRLSVQAEGAPICLLRVVRWVSSSFCLFFLSPLITGVEVENITKSRNYSDYQGHREGENKNKWSGHFGGRNKGY